MKHATWNMGREACGLRRLRIDRTNLELAVVEEASHLLLVSAALHRFAGWGLRERVRQVVLEVEAGSSRSAEKQTSREAGKSAFMGHRCYMHHTVGGRQAHAWGHDIRGAS